MKGKLIIAATGILLIGTGFVTMNQPKKPWVVPDKNARMVNPNKSDANSLKEGKELWSKHCQSCHGKSGLGDGPKAAQLKTEPGNFTLAATQQLSDGSFFYMSSEGRGDMPSFKKKLPEAEDLWNIVNYVRTFKK